MNPNLLSSTAIIISSFFLLSSTYVPKKGDRVISKCKALPSILSSGVSSEERHHPPLFKGPYKAIVKNSSECLLSELGGSYKVLGTALVQFSGNQKKSYNNISDIKLNGSCLRRIPCGELLKFEKGEKDEKISAVTIGGRSLILKRGDLITIRCLLGNEGQMEVTSNSANSINSPDSTHSPGLPSAYSRKLAQIHGNSTQSLPFIVIPGPETGGQNETLGFPEYLFYEMDDNSVQKAVTLLNRGKGLVYALENSKWARYFYKRTSGPKKVDFTVVIKDIESNLELLWYDLKKGTKFQAVKVPIEERESLQVTKDGQTAYRLTGRVREISKLAISPPLRCLPDSYVPLRDIDIVAKGDKTNHNKFASRPKSP